MLSEENIIPYHTQNLTGAKVLVLAPHPDDETLGCGGSVCIHADAGDKVKIVFLTDGSKGDSSKTAEKEAYIALRRREAEQACHCLGVSDTEFWLYEDRSLYMALECADRFSALMAEYRPDLVYVPSPLEIHPDHRAAAFLTEKYARTCEDDFSAVFYEVSQPLVFVNTLVDITPVLNRKNQAIQIYESQLRERPYGEFTLAMNRYRSLTLDNTVTHAEGFFVCEAKQMREKGILSVFYDNMEQMRPCADNVQESGLPDSGRVSAESCHKKKAFDESAPLVSVIIPTHNRPDMLKTAVESVLSQTYPNIEIIVVNDGGEDVSDMLNALNTRGNIVYIRHEENRGISAARNTALRAAKGHYIAYLDDDDMYYPDHVETLVKALKQSSFKIAYSDSHEIFKTSVAGQYTTLGRKDAYSSDFDRGRLLINNYIPTLNILHEKSAVDETGCFDEELESHEDWDLWIRFSLKYDFLHVRKITAAYTRISGGQIHITHNRMKLLDSLQKVHKRYSHLVTDPDMFEAQRQSESSLVIETDTEKLSEIISDYEFQHRYRFLSEFAKGKKILEIGCGCGEGCRFLSDYASDVIGIDTDIKGSRIMGRDKNNVLFVKGSSAHLPLKTEHFFDIVVYNAKKYADCTVILQEVKKNLKPRGIFVLYVPYASAHGYSTDRLFSDTPEEIRLTVEKHFISVRCFIHRMNTSSFFCAVSESRFPFEHVSVEKIGSRYMDSSKNRYQSGSVLLLASDAEETYGWDRTFCLTDSSETLYQHQKRLLNRLQIELKEKERFVDNIIRKKDGHISNLDKIIRNKEEYHREVLQGKNTHIENLDKILVHKEIYIKNLISEKDRHIGNLEKIISEKEKYIDSISSGKDGHIRNLEDMIQGRDEYTATLRDEKDGHIRNLEDMIRSKDEYIATLRDEKDRHIGNLENAIRNRDSEIQESGNHIQMLEVQIHEKNEYIRNLENILSEKDGYIHDLENIISEKDGHIHNLENIFGEKDGHIHNLENIIREKDRHIEDKEHQYLNMGNAVLLKENHIRNIEYELNTIKKSKAWRWTERFRKIFYEQMLGWAPLLRKSAMTISREGFTGFRIKAENYLKRNKNFICPSQTDMLYQRWIDKNLLPEKSTPEISREIASFSYKPKISIIMPVYNVEGKWLEKAIDSVIDQLYTKWELCIADDASTKKHIRKILSQYARRDLRIKVSYLKKNQGISGASNEALRLASGEFVALLDNDDELSKDALYEVVKLLNAYPETDMIYSDEDKLDMEGKRTEAFFKPDFSSDLLLSMNYICHFSVFRRSVINEIRGFRLGYEGSQDYDLILRFAEKTCPARIRHIPKILYHWRKIPGSAAAVVDAKNYAFVSARKALENYLERNQTEGEVRDGIFLGSYRVKRIIKSPDTVSVIIPFRDQVALLEKCLDSLFEKTDYPNYEILLMNNRSQEKSTFAFLEKMEKKDNITVLSYDKPFNFSAINNYAVTYAKGKFILLLNNDIEVISNEWMSAMVEHSQREEVGVVGAKLLYPNQTIQHGGVIMGIGIASHAFCHLPGNDNGYFGQINVVRNCSAVTGACLMTRKAVYEELGGLDEKNLTVAYNDVDFCLKAVKKGYQVVYTPFALLYHHESASRGNDNDKMLKEKNPEKYEPVIAERVFMEKKWKKYIDNDPYYNINLTRMNTDFAVRLR